MEYIDSLAAIPAEKRCWCGWNRLDQCPNCDPKTSLADRLELSCKQCRNYPRQNDPDHKITHSISCPITLEADMNAISSDDWSKLMTLAEFGAWTAANPRIVDMFDDPSIDPLDQTAREIVASLPQNLQGIGTRLAFRNDYYLPHSDNVMVEQFRKKVVLP